MLSNPSCKKGAAPKRPLWKKMWNPRWQPRNGCDGRLMANFLIMKIQVNLVLNPVEKAQHKFTWIVFIKNFAISLPQPFLGCHLRFPIFFQNGLFGVAPFLTAGLFWIRFLLLFVIAYCVARILPSLNIFCYLWFFLSAGTKSIFTGWLLTIAELSTTWLYLITFNLAAWLLTYS